jgi:hypothetical protein
MIEVERLLVGGFIPSEKYESQLGWLHFPIYGKNVRNHSLESLICLGKCSHIKYLVAGQLQWATKTTNANVRKDGRPHCETKQHPWTIYT